MGGHGSDWSVFGEQTLAIFFAAFLPSDGLLRSTDPHDRSLPVQLDLPILDPYRGGQGSRASGVHPQHGQASSCPPW